MGKHEDHGEHGHEEGHHEEHGHPQYDKFYDIDDHLKRNWTAEEEITVPFSRYGHDPYHFVYEDIYNNMPPLQWLHKRIRKTFGADADVKDEVLQEFWKGSHKAWLPSWRVFRYDPHHKRFSRGLRSEMSLLTAGDGVDDYIHAQLVLKAEHADEEALNAIKQAAEDEMLKCYERHNLHGENSAYADPHRLSQITHRFCLFNTWSEIIKKGLLEDPEVNIASHNVKPSWWGLWKWHTAGVAGPIKRIPFTKWWNEQQAKREEILALQQESEAVSFLLSDARVFNRTDINGQEPADFLRKVEKYFNDVLVPKQKELFPQSEFGKNPGNVPITGSDLDKRRDVFFRNYKKTGNYWFCCSEVPETYFHHNNYAEGAVRRNLASTQ